MSNSTCTVVPASVDADAGVAGAGVLLSFIITAFLALTLSILIIFHEFRPLNRQWTIPRKLLLSLSDQQILTGIGIQSVGLAKIDSMVPYHFFLIWMLSLLSTATHLATLLALVADFRRDWVLRWLRQGLMLANLVLSCAFGVILLQSIMKKLPQTVPVACVWNAATPQASSGPSTALSIIGTVAVIAGSLLVFVLGTLYLHNTKNPRWLRPVQVLGLLFLAAVAVGATVRVLLLSQAFGHPSVALDSEQEKEWSFGQLLPLLLLLLPLNSVIEMWRGEMKVPKPVLFDTGRDGLLRTTTKNGGGVDLRENEYWASRTELVQE